MEERPGLIEWTRDALERLFDLAYLRHHILAPAVAGRYQDCHIFQQTCLDVIREFKPPLSLPAISPAWRIYNVLNLRYVQGLSQSETAVQLGISTRQMRREQQRALQAVAAVLFNGEVTGADTVPEAPDAEQALAVPALWEQSDDPTLHYSHLDEMLRSTLILFDPLIEQQHLRVMLALPSSMPLIRGDQMILRQMLVSGISWLIRDAHDATITIDASIARRQVVLSLVKPQTGARSEHVVAQDEIATARQLAALIAAEVSLRDDAGSVCLQFSLPTNDAKCVLMVDDHMHAIQLVRRYLQQSDDFYLEAISTPSEVLRHVATQRPACILLDVMMPERDGWEVLTLLRAHPELRAIPIIISSVLKETDLAYSLGATAVLPKPYSAEELINLLRSVTQAPGRNPREL